MINETSCLTSCLMSQMDAVLGGDIDEFVVGYHRWKAAQ